MKHCLTLFLLCFALNSFGQNYKFGKVSKEELEETYYPQDSTAEAAYLYDKRRTFYDYSQNDGFRIITEVHQRIKIYSKEGFDQATREIDYYSPDSNRDREKVRSIEAVTYNLEGGKIVKSKISKKDIFDEERSKYYSRKKVTLPNIKEGSVIEIEYKLISPHLLAIDDLELQHGIPVKKMYRVTEIPEYFKFKTRMKGYYMVNPKVTNDRRSILWIDGSKTNYNVQTSVYDAENIPALKDNEPYVNNVANYRGAVNYEIDHYYFPGNNPKYFSSSWSDVAKTIYSGIGGEIDQSNYYKNDLAALIQGAGSDSDKIIKIFQFVKEKVKWNGYPGYYPDSPLKKAYKEGTGNVAVINLMLISMLRSAGLDANPVLVSTKANGVPLFPTRDGFNYVVAAVSFGDGYVLMDASEHYSLPNMLPPRTLNWQGRLILKNGSSRWVNLSSGTKSEEDDFISVKIDADGMVEGMMRTKFSNLGALEYRNENNRIKEEELITRLEDKFSIEIENYKVSNKLDLGKDVTRTIKFSSEDLIEEINGKMYIRPLLFKGYTANPFKSNERKFPIEFSSPWAEKSTVTIELPEGYTIESIPETKALGLPDDMGVFKYQVISQGNKVRVVSALEFNTATIPANYYETLKGFFGEFVEKQSEKIVLVKS
jgi:hypothetical protein